MRHVSLTCKNHPTLRWSTKSIAWSTDNTGKAGYNGSRNLFFKGDLGDSVPAFYSDGSGIAVPMRGAECPCDASCLVLAPEDGALYAFAAFRETCEKATLPELERMAEFYAKGPAENQQAMVMTNIARAEVERRKMVLLPSPVV